MKLQELLKIDTSKSNWFKIFARNGINVKTVSSVSNGGGVGNSSKYAPRYFNIDFNIADEGWKHLLTMKDSSNPIHQDNIFVNIGASYKVIADEENRMIVTYPFYGDVLHTKYQFSYVPLYIPDGIAYSFGIKGGFITFEDIITIMPAVLRVILEKDVTLSMKGITEITEEEFYKME